MKLMIIARIWVDKLTSKLRREEGQGLVEYGLILALVAIAVVGVLTTLGGDLKSKITAVSTELTKPTP